MHRTLALGLALLAIAAALALAGAFLHASAGAAQAACEASDSCYVSGRSIGDSILSARFLLWAGFVGVAGLATAGYGLLRPLADRQAS